ncbi:sigma-54-dependent transcriptional regulator [Pelomicrobium methylotrophicum]|uniref:Sigma-54-dependent Fis family transcriptional regulator n=1 Tax=Pelomicrobium methylotrophicum TaxID=2602750 RepID=A0A5C7EZF9_9PROT|nr:sigma-54-dependent Fis family transcriptional regulator [Pelomicrobium methylotrophicum]
MAGSGRTRAAPPEVQRTPADTPWDQYAVLVVDDEEGMRNFISRALKNRGCGMVESAATAEEGAQLVERCHFDLVILDIALPGKAGVVWLKELRESGFHGEVILITAFADLETAIDALRAGASDFILKPFRIDQLLNSIQRCFDRARLARENFVLRREVRELAGLEDLLGQSAAAEELRRIIRRLAPLPTTVLIQGESGTGKEVAARALHKMSPRAQRPFVPVNCGAISPEIIESELFGHVKGAFTGATESRNGLFFYAQGGTLFLDEIGELPLPMQTKLLRVLEEKKIRPVGSEREIPVDVRIVAATNRNLAPEVAAGRFRQDLFYRLDVVNITIPPLRERPEDIPVLARHFMEELSARLGVPRVPLTPDIVEALVRYPWPGNARELRNLVERSLILGRVPLENLQAADRSRVWKGAPAPAVALEEVEKQHILSVLREVQGNKSEAARRLGISRKTLERKCALWKVS